MNFPQFWARGDCGGFFTWRWSSRSLEEARNLAQEDCFRARLTPKPWRCGIHQKPHRWPWLNERQEKNFRKWDHEYQSHAAKWATCVLIRRIGNPHTHPVVQSIVNLHDAATRAASKLPLA